MIKARLSRTPDGADPLIVIGLSEENVKRLKLGHPIRFDGAEIGLPGYTFGVVYGETEEAIAKELLAGITTEGNA